MRLVVPKLRTWHLLGIVAASAAFFSVMQFRWVVEDPGYGLIRRLRSTEAAERSKAAHDLLGIRPRERRAIGPLTEMLFDPDPRARASAARALQWIVTYDDESERAPVKAALTSALGDPDPSARLEIARVLCGLGPEPKVIVPTLLGFARDADPIVRRDAVFLLGIYGRRSEPALDALFSAINDEDLEVKVRSIATLGDCSIDPDLAPGSLLGRLESAFFGAADDARPRVRAVAVVALARIARRTHFEIPRIIEALGDPDPWVRSGAAHGLDWSRLARRSEALLPALVRTLADPDARVRMNAVRTLGSLGVDAESAIPAIRGLANDPEEEVAYQSARAIEAIEKSARELRTVTLPQAIADLSDADPIVRELAASRLEDLGSRGAEAVPSLVRCLDDPEADVRRASAGALGQMGPSARVAVPSLAKLAESDPDERVRRAATLARAILLRGVGDSKGER